ncbi:MAG: M23 family peptidase, partial [Novosphingobium sp.]
MTLLDRIATILITATVTSAAWIVAGGSVLDLAGSSSQIARTRPADAQPSPESSDVSISGDASGNKVSAPPLETDDLTAPNDTEAQQIIVPVLNVRPSDLSDTFA